MPVLVLMACPKQPRCPTAAWPRAHDGARSGYKDQAVDFAPMQPIEPIVDFVESEVHPERTVRIPVLERNFSLFGTIDSSYFIA